MTVLTVNCVLALLWVGAWPAYQSEECTNTTLNHSKGHKYGFYPQNEWLLDENKTDSITGVCEVFLSIRMWGVAIYLWRERRDGSAHNTLARTQWDTGTAGSLGLGAKFYPGTPLTAEIVCNLLHQTPVSSVRSAQRFCCPDFGREFIFN